jgi:hypothetical protein
MQTFLVLCCWRCWLLLLLLLLLLLVLPGCCFWIANNCC